MRNSHIFVILTIILLLGGLSFGQKATKRDFQQYDKGGKFEFSWGAIETHKKSGEQLREFIWKHWSKKTRGRVEVVHYSVEGDPVTRQIYIEPDLNGKWQITSEWDSYCCALYSLERPRRKRVHRHGIDVYKVVERVEGVFSPLIPSSVGTGLSIPSGEDRAADKYILNLKKQPSDEPDLTI